MSSLAQFSMSPESADETVQSPDVDTLNLKVMKSVDDLHLSPPQSVQLGHNQLVFGFQHRQTRMQLMAVLYGRPTADDLIEDVGHPASFNANT